MRAFIYGLSTLCLFTAPVPALAQTPAVNATPTVAPETPPSVAPTAETIPVSIDEVELAELNGRQGRSQVSVLSDQDLVAVNNGNTIVAGRVGSGDISIDRGAFEGFAGIGNFVINSGHNNNLQGAITINIVQP
jgi:hypothetical protein